MVVEEEVDTTVQEALDMLVEVETATVEEGEVDSTVEATATTTMLEEAPATHAEMEGAMEVVVVVVDTTVEAVAILQVRVNDFIFFNIV